MRFPDSEMLRVVEKAKILGLRVSRDLKWSSNTDHLIKKAMKNLWVLRRLKNLGFDKNILFDIYQNEIRSILEFGTPVWHSSISEHDADRLEQVQKKVFRLLLQNQYKSY